MNVQRIPHTSISERGTEGQQASSRNPPARRRQQRAIWAGVELATAVHALRDRRLQVTVITWAVGLAALAGLARENRNRTFARLAAWDRRLSERYSRTGPG
ncbi:MAG TPA: hypothetical protein VGM53_07815 [Streptosporangiaceae bacterium]